MLDDEQLKKADLENQLARLDEDLKFKLQVLEKELTEVKTRKEIEIHEMDGKLQEEYEDRLQQALEELRAVYDKQMQQNRDDFAKLYDDRVSDERSESTRSINCHISCFSISLHISCRLLWISCHVSCFLLYISYHISCFL